MFGNINEKKKAFLCFYICQAFGVAERSVLPASACFKGNQEEFLNKYFPSCTGTQTPSPSHQIQRMNKRQQLVLCMLLYLNKHSLHFEFASTHLSEKTQNQT